MGISVEFQERFLELVAEQELKPLQLAKNMSISIETYSKIKLYGIVPTPKILTKIADYFDVSIEYLLARTDDEYFDKAKMPKTFHKRVEQLRSEKNITFYEIAKRVHLEPNCFSIWKNRNFIPSLDNLILLADFFEVSLDYLLGRTDDK